MFISFFTFALPAYNTYKAIAHAQHNIPALATYWVVLGLFVTFEQTLGFILSWLPFYWELRTLFLLYISLPQTQGFLYVYKTLIEPWLSSNEATFDDALASAQSNTIAFCRTRITVFLDLVWSLLNNTPPADTQKSVVSLDQASKDPSYTSPATHIQSTEIRHDFL